MVAFALGGPRVAAAPGRPGLARPSQAPLRRLSPHGGSWGARPPIVLSARLPHAPSRSAFAASRRVVALVRRAPARPSRSAAAAGRGDGPNGDAWRSEDEEEGEESEDEEDRVESDGESESEEEAEEEAESEAESEEEAEEEAESEAESETESADREADGVWQKEATGRLPASAEQAGARTEVLVSRVGASSDSAGKLSTVAEAAPATSATAETGGPLDLTSLEPGSSAAGARASSRALSPSPSPSPSSLPSSASLADARAPSPAAPSSSSAASPPAVRPAPPPSPRYLPSEALRIARSGPLLRDLIFRRIEQTGSRTPLLAGPAVPPNEWLRRAQGRFGMPTPGEEEAKGVTDDEGLVLAAEVLEADGVPPPRWDYGIMPLRGECVPAEVTLAPRPPNPAGRWGWAAQPMTPDELLHGIHVRTWTSAYYDPAAPFWDIQMRCHRGHWLTGGYDGWRAYVVERSPPGNEESATGERPETRGAAGPADGPADGPSPGAATSPASPASAPPASSASPASSSSSLVSSQIEASDVAPSRAKTPGYMRPRTGRVFRVSLPHPGMSTYAEDYLGGGVGLGLFEPRRIDRRAVATGNIDLVGYEQIFQALFEAYEEKSPVGWWLEEGDPGKLEGPRFGRPRAPDGGPYPQGGDPQPATSAEAARGLLAPYAPSPDNDIVETETLREADPEGYFAEVQRARALALAAARASPVARELIARESAESRQRRRQRLSDAVRAAQREATGSGFGSAFKRGGWGFKALWRKLLGRGAADADAPAAALGERGGAGGGNGAEGADDDASWEQGVLGGPADRVAHSGVAASPSHDRGANERSAQARAGSQSATAAVAGRAEGSASCGGEGPVSSGPASSAIGGASSSSSSSVPLPLIPRYLDLEGSPSTLRAARLAYVCPADDSLRVTFIDETRSLLENPFAVAFLALSLPPVFLTWVLRGVPSLRSLTRFRRLNVPRDVHSALSFAESKGNARADGSTGVTFADVGGLGEVVGELRDAVAFLKDPAGFGRLGARPPGGILLEGPPGTGKTLLAKALAGEAGVPFYEASGSEFVEAIVGVGAARVRHLFARAAARAPAVVFVDELDALGTARARTGGGADEEREQALNQLLCQLDGFAPRAGVLLVAATNRAALLDPALLRPGRFDRHLLVPLPDQDAREDILRVCARSLRTDDDVDLAALARDTPGLSGAELGALLNEAAYVADARRAARVQARDLDEACARITEGAAFEPARKDPDELARLAAAEAAVAIVAHALAQRHQQDEQDGGAERRGVGSPRRSELSGLESPAMPSPPTAPGTGPEVPHGRGHGHGHTHVSGDSRSSHSSFSPTNLPFLERPELCSVEARASGPARTRFRRLSPEGYTLATEGRLRARLRVLLARRAGQLSLCGRGQDDEHAAESVRRAATLALRGIAMYGFALVEGGEEFGADKDVISRSASLDLTSPFAPVPYCPPRLSESGEALETREGGSLARGLVDLDSTGEPDPPAGEAPPPPTDLARARVELRVQAAVRAAAEDALNVLLKRRETLRRLAERLVETKTVQGAELADFLAQAEAEAQAWERRWGDEEKSRRGDGSSSASESLLPASAVDAFVNFARTATASPSQLRHVADELLPPISVDWEVRESVEAAVERVRTLRTGYFPRTHERRGPAIEDALF